MKTINATEAKREFGDMLLKVQSAPVSINKNGKLIAVLVSAEEYEQLELLKIASLKASIQVGIDDIKADRVSDGDSVINRLRERLD